MNKRILVIVMVFVAGFGAGYGMTWLLVSGPGPARSGEAVAEVAPEAPGAVVGADEPGALDAPTRQDDGATVLAGDDDPPDPPDPNDPTEPGAGDRAAPSDQDRAKAASPSPGEVDPELAPRSPAPWWERCLGKVCRVDFGRVTGGLSVREGTITHGEDVVWRDRFADAERVGTLPVRRGLRVELHAVGMLHQLPVAAQITWPEAPGKPLSGVIALNIGDKIIHLAEP